jgi:Cdc6-like AAA superfamily ATPase
MIYEDELGIIANPDILKEEYLPPNIPGRKAQIRELSFCFQPTAKGKKLLHVWISGKPGTGKTSTCKYVLKKLESEADGSGIYINC